MAFKNPDKTALIRLLSEFVRADGIVNQNEICYLQYIYGILNITPDVVKNAATLDLADAVRQLAQLEIRDKYAVMKMVQQLVLSDNELSPEESLLLTALTISLQVGHPDIPSGRILSVEGFTRKVEGNVLYVEASYDESVNREICDQYDSLVSFLKGHHYDFFYLPAVIHQIGSRKAVFRNTLQYIQPELSAATLDQVDRQIHELSTSFFAREMFLNQMSQKGLSSLKPSFFFQLPDQNENNFSNFLLVEIDERQPEGLLRSFFSIREHICDLIATLPPAVYQDYLSRFNRDSVDTIDPESDFQCYTGFHKIIIDTILKYNASQQTGNLFIDETGRIFLKRPEWLEVKMPALARAFYLFYLQHEEGIRLDELKQYRSEILAIYRRVSTYQNEDQLKNTVRSLTDYTGNTLNTTISRIKKAFVNILGSEAPLYLIAGEKGAPKKIHLDRRRVESAFDLSR